MNKKRNSKIKSLLSQYLILLIGIILLGHNLGFAQQEAIVSTGDPSNLVVDDPNGNFNPNSNVSDEEAKKMEQQFQQYQEQLMKSWETKMIFNQARLIKSKKDLEKNIDIFSDSDRRIQEYNQILKPIEQKISSLKEHLQFLDEQLASTQYKVTNVREQIIEKEQQIRTAMEDIDVAKVQLQAQEKILLEYVKLIYNHEQQYLDSDDKSISDVKLLMLDKPVSKTITTGEYLTIIQKTGENILKELEKVYTSLAEKEAALETKQGRLQALKVELERQQSDLQDEQAAKKQLLEVTQNDEKKYQELIAQTEREKEQAGKDAELLQSSIQSIQTQLESLKKNARTPGTQDNIQKKAESAATLYETTPVDENSELPLSWPVEPKNGVSAYFHDDSYINVFGVDHGAVDIPTPQGSEIHAPADGLVYKTADNGFGYSYIILAHRNMNGKSVLTLYGHVSQILLHEGDLVRRGDVIGLSGGAPGSRGAGARTTGSHLHFEVWIDGKKDDPLKYLDVSIVPREKIISSKVPAPEFTKK